ncbi:MAG TPA: ATP-dependent Clp protease proteolytic subunit [Candidatus Binatia bacterium]|nr:ATP-dependent Clp protease proteolytic subunit [Candidatus Binatia bacterium]
MERRKNAARHEGEEPSAGPKEGPLPEIEFEAGSPRVITVTGVINGQDVEKVADRLAGLNMESSEPIIVQFCSSGGHLQSGWALHDLFSTNAVPVITVGFGYVGSAATVAFQGGVARFLAPHAKLMIHLVGFSSEDGISFDLKDMRKQMKEMTELQDDIEKMLARRTGKPLKTIKAWCEEETEFSAREAVKNGFADRVLHARRPGKVRGK